MVSERSLTKGYKKQTLQTPDEKISQSTCHYIFCLIGNISLIALYAVQVFNSHKTCLVDDVNITRSLNFAFAMGFTIVISDFINSSILVLLRRSPQNTSKQSFTPGVQQMIHTKKIVMIDWVIIILTLFVSVVQFTIISSKGVVFCSVIMETLVSESKWLAGLIVG